MFDEFGNWIEVVQDPDKAGPAEGEGDDITSGTFTLADIDKRFMDRESHLREVASRDKKITSLLDQQKDEAEKSSLVIDGMKQQISDLTSAVGLQSNQTKLDRFDLNEQEREAMDSDTLGAVNKLVGRGQQETATLLAQLTDKVAALGAATPDDTRMDQRFAALDDVVQRTARASIGVDRYANDAGFIGWAKSAKYSVLGQESVFDVYQQNSALSPADPLYSSALSEQASIISLYEQEKAAAVVAGNTAGAQASVQTSGKVQQKSTPQQSKLQAKVESLISQRRAQIDSGNIPEAQKLLAGIASAKAELMGSLKG